MYPQPSMDSPRMAGKVGGKVIREYNVPPAIHGQSEDGLKHRMESYPRIEGNVPPAIHRQSEQREREGS